MRSALAFKSNNPVKTGSHALQRDPSHNSRSNFSNRNHCVSSVSRANHATEMNVKSYLSNDKTIRELPIDEIGERELAKRIGDALIVDFGNHKATNKEVAKKAGSPSVKTAENWTAGNNPPSLLYFLRLYAKSPALQAEVRRLTAMEAGIDPNFQREFARFMQRMDRV